MLAIPALFSKSVAQYLQKDEGKTLILIGKIQLLDNQSLLSAPLCPCNDYSNNDIPEMPWLDCDSVRCNCSKFALLGNVIIHSVEFFLQMLGLKWMKMRTLAALQAATILVVMASEKKIGD